MRRDLATKATLAVGALCCAIAIWSAPALAQVDTYGETPPPVLTPPVVNDNEVTPPGQNTPPDQNTPPNEVPPPVVEDDGVTPGPEVPVDDEVAPEDEVTVDVLEDRVEVAGVQQQRGIAGLPVTGGDLLGLAAIGAGALALGSALVLRRRSLS